MTTNIQAHQSLSSMPNKQHFDDWVMSDQPSNIEDYYELGKNIGQPGQFGYAIECIRKSTGELFAAKVINKYKFKLLNQKRLFYSQLRDEINIMRSLKHENIIGFFEVFEDNINVYVIMEHCSGGELFDRISAKGSYSEKDAAFVLRQVVKGLEYLHRNKIAHCDLKPDNFLFLTSNEDSQLKIIDFGMSKIVKVREYFRKFCGTPYYVAPEVIRGCYNESCDMQSVGIVMFVMLYGYPPFYNDPNEYNADHKILEKVKKGFTPKVLDNYGPWFPKSIACSDSARDLITKLLEYNHVKRLTAAEALEHPQLKGESCSTQNIDPEVIKGLKTFRQSCRFKQIVLSVMVNHLQDDQIEVLKQQFEKMDKDKNGVISQAELKAALNEVDSNIDDSEVANIMNALDVNSDGVVSYEELSMATVNRKLIAKEERLQQAFRLIDLNGDGRITAQELSEAAVNANISEHEAREMIKKVDIDGDGTIDYEEFLYLFQQPSVSGDFNLTQNNDKNI